MEGLEAEAYDDNFIENGEEDELNIFEEDELNIFEEEDYEDEDEEDFKHEINDFIEEDFKHEIDDFIEEIGETPYFLENIEKYEECEKIIKKSIIKSKLILNEFRKIYYYRNLLQKYKKQNKCKFPFDINIIISKAELIHNEKKESSIEYREKLIKLVDNFCINKLITIYGNYMPKSHIPIFSEGIKNIVILIRTELSSKKIINSYKFGIKGLNYCLDIIYKKCLLGIINPGENIGTFVATSIAEPSTQLTLNTFHTAGKSQNNKVNATTKRLEQLLTLSKSIKSSDIYMTISLKEKDNNSKEVLNKTILYFDNNIFNYFVKEYQIVQDNIIKLGSKGTTMKKDKKIIDNFLKFNELPKKLSILCLRVKLNSKALFIKNMSIEMIETTIKNKFPNTYIISSGIGIIRIYIKGIIYEDEFLVFKNMLCVLETLRVTGISGINNIEISKQNKIIYDNNGNKIKKSVPVIYTSGSNFTELCKYSYLIDINNSWTNNISEINKELGIEAAGNVLFDEIYNVFKSNGINISSDNISLLVDHMTSIGTAVPISRHGLKKSKSSTLQQISLEMPLSYMKDSALIGKNENIKGTSDNIFFGQPITGATSSFDLIMNN
jgi:DNA-directed RNA polymerase II subunit RPB1